MADLVLSIRLTADGKGLVGEVRGSADEIRKLGQAANQSNAQGRGAADQFSASLKRQADTLGMTKSQTLAYEAAQHDLTGAQKQGVAESIRAIDAYDKKQAMLGRVRVAAAAAGSAIAAAFVVVLKASVAAAIEAEQAYLKLEAVLRATGGASLLSMRQLDDMAESMKRATGIDDDQIRNSMAVMLTFRQIQGDTFRQAMTMAADLTRLLGQDLQSSVTMLGKALQDPESGLTALGRAGVSFDDAQKSMIKNMITMGDQSRALTSILQIMRDQGIDRVAESMNRGLFKATNDLKLEWDDMLKVLGRSDKTMSVVNASLEITRRLLESIKLLAEQDVMGALGGARTGAIAGSRAPLSPKDFGGQSEQDIKIAQLRATIADAQAGGAKKLGEQLQKNEELRKLDIAGWVAHADAVFAAAFEEAQALALIADAQNKIAEANEARDFEEAARVRDNIAQRVEQIRRENLTELELMIEQREEKVALLNAWAGEDVERQAWVNQQKELIDKNHQAKLVSQNDWGIKSRSEIEKMGGVQQLKYYTGTLASITAAGAQHSRALFNLNKAAGIANAIVSTYQGAAEALKWGFPLGPIFAAVIVAAGLANIAAIKKAEFGAGTSAPSIGGGSAIPTFPAPGSPPTTISAAPPQIAEARTRAVVTFVNQSGRDQISIQQVAEEIAPKLLELISLGAIDLEVRVT